MTTIEQALFHDDSAHCISSFALSPAALVLTLHPWERADVAVRAQLQQPRIVSSDDSHASVERELPWDIIGFDSEQLASGGWRFASILIALSMFLIRVGQRLRRWPNQSAAANRHPAGQGGSGNLFTTVAACRASPAAVADLGRSAK